MYEREDYRTITSEVLKGSCFCRVQKRVYSPPGGILLGFSKT